jgi:hypothetical protein
VIGMTASENVELFHERGYAFASIHVCHHAEPMDGPM